MRRFIEFNNGRANFHALVRFAQKAFDISRTWRGNLDDCLFGLDRNQRLVGYNVIAFGHMPSDDLGILKSFT